LRQEESRFRSLDSFGDDSTPLPAARTTRAQASSTATSGVDPTAAGSLFRERLRQEESRFRSLNSFGDLVMIRRRFQRLKQPVLKRPRPPLVVSTRQQPEASFERDCVRKSRDFGRSTPLVMIRRRFRRLEQPVPQLPRPPLVVSTRTQPEASFERDSHFHSLGE
jgi:dihydrofolate reductase